MNTKITRSIDNYTIGLLVITLFGILLRLIGILSFPVSFEESHSLLVSQIDSIFLIIKTAPAEGFPPLSFLIWRLWQIFSRDLLFLRLPSLIFGTLAILSLAHVGKKLFSPAVGLICALLVAVSPSLIYHSSIGRMYSLGVLEFVWIIFIFIGFISGKSSLFLFALLMLLGLYTHFFFIPLFFMLNLYLIFFAKRGRKILLQFLAADLAIVLLFSPIIYQALTSGLTFAVPANTTIKLPIFYASAAITPDLFNPTKLYSANLFNPIKLTVMASYLLFVAILIWGSVVLRKNNQIRLLSFIYITTPILLLIFSYNIYRIANIRSYILFSPLFFLIAATLLASLQKKIRIILLIVIISLPGLFLFTYFLTDFESKNTLKSIYSNFGKDDLVIYNDPNIFLPTRILKTPGNHVLMYSGHLKEDSLNRLGIQLGNPSSLKAQVPHQKVWYAKLQTNWPPFDKAANKLESMLEERHLASTRLIYDDIQLILYKPKIAE